MRKFLFVALNLFISVSVFAQIAPIQISICNDSMPFLPFGLGQFRWHTSISDTNYTEGEVYILKDNIQFRKSQGTWVSLPDQTFHGAHNDRIIYNLSDTFLKAFSFFPIMYSDTRDSILNYKTHNNLEVLYEILYSIEVHNYSTYGKVWSNTITILLPKLTEEEYGLLKIFRSSLSQNDQNIKWFTTNRYQYTNVKNIGHFKELLNSYSNTVLKPFMEYEILRSERQENMGAPLNDSSKAKAFIEQLKSSPVSAYRKLAAQTEYLLQY